MTDEISAKQISREALLNLLSDAEVAKVSTAEGAPTLAKGEDYIDLEHLDQGVQQSTPGTKITMGHILPRSAVSDETWNKIIASLAR